MKKNLELEKLLHDFDSLYSDVQSEILGMFGKVYKYIDSENVTYYLEVKGFRDVMDIVVEYHNNKGESFTDVFDYLGLLDIIICAEDVTEKVLDNK